MTVDGEPISPAFVILTNHTFLGNEDMEGNPCFAVLETIKIDDYPCGREIEIEAALEAYDKYRDIFWMTRALEVAGSIPVTFDGTPPELLSPGGQPQKTLQIGDILLAQDQQGHVVPALVEDIASMGDKAMVAVYDAASNSRWLVEVPLSEGEAKAAARFSDAIFGKNTASRALRPGDPFDLYDFFLKAQANINQQQVDQFFDEHPTVSQYRGLPLKEARMRIARENTKWMWERSNHVKRQQTTPEMAGQRPAGV